MKVERRIHKGFEEYEEAIKRKIKIPQFFGKYQYIFSNSKGKISLVKLKGIFGKLKWYWEIYCLKGNLFEDVEKFRIKKEAIKSIKEYLDVDDLAELIEEKIERDKKEKIK